MNDYNLTEILEYIDPSTCSYQEWINVGMALKHEDIRYLIGICGV